VVVSLSDWDLHKSHVWWRYLFWSDGTQSNAKIERSDLSGRNRTVLRSATQGLIAPTTLVVDFSSQKLYWLDSAAQKIGRINFDGSDPDTWTHSNFRITTSITVYQVPYDTTALARVTSSHQSTVPKCNMLTLQTCSGKVEPYMSS